MCALHQVHGDHVVVAQKQKKASNQRIDWQGQADAILTRQKGQTVGVASADCVPVLLWLENEFAGALHVGWRSAARDIVGKTIAFIREHWAIPEKAISALIGPALCQACFEVGEEVLDAFSKFKELKDHPSLVLRHSSPARQENDKARKAHFDLRGFVHLRLRQLGLLKRNIDSMGYCTRCEPELLHSYRRDKTEKRQWALIKF